MPERLGSLDPCECCATAPCFDLSGKLALLYRDKRQNNRDMYFVPDALSLSPAKTQLNAGNWKMKFCPMTGSSLVMLSGGGFAAGWEEKGAVYLTIAISPSAVGKQISLGKGKYPKVLVMPDGTIFITWKQGTTILWKAFDRAGKELASGNAGSSAFTDRFGAAFSRHGDILISP